MSQMHYEPMETRVLRKGYASEIVGVRRSRKKGLESHGLLPEAEFELELEFDTETKQEGVKRRGEKRKEQEDALGAETIHRRLTHAPVCAHCLLAITLSASLSPRSEADALHDDTPLSVGSNTELPGVPRLFLELGAAELWTMLEALRLLLLAAETETAATKRRRSLGTTQAGCAHTKMQQGEKLIVLTPRMQFFLSTEEVTAHHLNRRTQIWLGPDVFLVLAGVPRAPSSVFIRYLDPSMGG
ncbi:hypothetical protein B0H14DRAFT_3178683 [Mycena olivaceomarginata]|nr:hypothetical protein B0H14DRAFT_3178683 [Mycena olivaceomarginata]